MATTKKRRKPKPQTLDEARMLATRPSSIHELPPMIEGADGVYVKLPISGDAAAGVRELFEAGQSLADQITSFLDAASDVADKFGRATKKRRRR